MLLYALLHLTGYDLPMDELQALPPAAQQDAGPPRSRPDARASRPPPARSARASPTRWAWRWPRSCWPPSSTAPGHDDRRPPHLCLPRRRLPDGRHQPRGLLAGRHVAAEQADRALRRQRHLDRRPGGRLVHATTRRRASRAYGWNVIGPIDGHDVRRRRRRPIAQAKTSSRQAHADRLPHDHRQGLARHAPAPPRRMASRWAPTRSPGHARGARLDRAPFEVPAAVRARLGRARSAARAREAEWHGALRGLPRAHPALAAEFERRMRGDLPRRLRRQRARRGHRRASRQRRRPSPRARPSQKVLDALAPLLPELFGGSADLTGSNLTDFKGCGTCAAASAGQPHHYGVREFGMAAIMNGIALHGGYIPYGGTFLTFSDYSRNADPHGRADEAARDPRLHARLDRPGRRRADAPGGRARALAAPDPAASTSGGPADGLETAVAWACAVRAARRARPRWRCRARTCRAWRSAGAWPRHPRAAATCWPTRPSAAGA